MYQTSNKLYTEIIFLKFNNKRVEKLMTRIRTNTKNYFIDLVDKQLFRKRFYINTTFTFLKNSINLAYNRYKFPINFY